MKSGICCERCRGKIRHIHKEKCPKECTVKQDGSSTSRFLSSEVGFHLKFNFDENGLPRGCPIFNGQEKTMDWFR